MRFRSDPDKISTPDAHRGREFTPSGPDTCQSNPLGGGRDDQFRYTTSGHARLPFGLGKILPFSPSSIAALAFTTAAPFVTVERLASLHVELPSDRAFPLGTFLRHLKLFHMTIQQDPYETDRYEPDPWWFAPLLYVGLCLAIVGLPMAGLHLIVALGVR